MRRLGIAAAVVCVFASAAAAQTDIFEYAGMCDASAGIGIDAETFVVVNDEDNTLRAYRRGQRDAVGSFDLTSFLKPDPENPETDLEGGARIGERVYWITSHGRNSKGKERPSRHRLFATVISVDGGAVTLKPVGEPYGELLEALVNDPGLKKYKLKKASKKAPEDKDGLNIEGLAATPQGTLFIGFRNPIRDGKALLVPVLNPAAVVDQQKKPKFGAPIGLALGGLGIRSIEYIDARQAFMIVAGSYDDTPNFRLFEWSGLPKDKPKLLKGVDFKDLSPEGLFTFPTDASKLYLVSDDGSKDVNGEACKDVADPKKKTFRGFFVTP